MKIIRRFLGFNVLVLCLVCMIVSCKKDHNNNATGNLTFKFLHYVDGAPVRFDTLVYVNEAGNIYMINDFQYFISDVMLFKSDGKQIAITNDSYNIHYVGSMYPSTFQWDVNQEIPTGEYDSISFLFGISPEKNKTNLFVNSPERDMFWPDLLGGGYHQLMLNGKWYNTNSAIVPFNCHLGIGVEELNTGDTIFHQNCFRVSLPGSGFTINSDQNSTLAIRMNIESWFKTPHAWNWNVIGGAIMQNWQAMQMLKENGYDVFSVN